VSAAVRHLGIAELEQRIGKSRVTVWRWMRAGTFPAAHYIGTRRAWLIAEIEAWEREQYVRAPPPPVRKEVAATAPKPGSCAR
jgi:predicted DNA-binding transcriptional regulator AlpA